MSKRTDIRKRRKEIEKWISDGIPKSEISRRLVCNPKTLSSILKEWEIDYKGKQGFFGSNSKKYVPAKNYLGTKKNIPSYKLKEKLFKEKIKEKRCEKCGLNKWLDVSIPLELHHIDGNHYNNELKNLSILCPNCHAMTENYRGKNISKTLKIKKEKPFKCLKCNKGIYKNISKLCYECFTIENRRIKNIKKPNKDELFSLLKKESFSKVGEILGVSDNGVRKWCIEYGIPNKASFYKKFKK